MIFKKNKTKESIKLLDNLKTKIKISIAILAGVGAIYAVSHKEPSYNKMNPESNFQVVDQLPFTYTQEQKNEIQKRVNLHENEELIQKRMNLYIDLDNKIENLKYSLLKNLNEDEFFTKIKSIIKLAIEVKRINNNINKHKHNNIENDILKDTNQTIKKIIKLYQNPQTQQLTLNQIDTLLQQMEQI